MGDYRHRAEAKDPIVYKQCKGLQTLQTCRAAFSQKCFNASWGQGGPARHAFSQCCQMCMQAGADQFCRWTVESHGQTIGSSWTYPTSDACYDTCNAFPDAVDKDICPNGKIHLLMKDHCEQAWPKVLSLQYKNSVKATVCCKWDWYKKLCGLSDSDKDGICGKEGTINKAGFYYESGTDAYGVHHTSSCPPTESSSSTIEALQTDEASSVGFGALVTFVIIGATVAFLLQRKIRRTQSLDGYVHLAA